MASKTCVRNRGFRGGALNLARNHERFWILCSPGTSWGLGDTASYETLCYLKRLLLEWWNDLNAHVHHQILLHTTWYSIEPLRYPHLLIPERVLRRELPIQWVWDLYYYPIDWNQISRSRIFTTRSPVIIMYATSLHSDCRSQRKFVFWHTLNAIWMTADCSRSIYKRHN